MVTDDSPGRPPVLICWTRTALTPQTQWVNPQEMVSAIKIATMDPYGALSCGYHVRVSFTRPLRENCVGYLGKIAHVRLFYSRKHLAESIYSNVSKSKYHSK